jgi:NAD(P)-dependent dehydrogenase (short-subunit alcohol dehydrogenase family)
LSLRLVVSELVGRHAIVTGGAAGIGKAIAQALTQAGAAVSIIDLDGDGAQKVARRINGRSYTADARDASCWRHRFEEIERVCPEWDVLVNNAGGAAAQRLEDISVEDWDQCLAVNLRAAFIATQAAFAPMGRCGGGAIVNVASIAAHSVSPVAGAAYAAAKAGLLALTRQTAFEWAKYGIRANAVCPGPTRTEITSASSRTEESFPLGRWVQPEDVAEAVLYLASPRSAMCTGTSVDVDGGVRVGSKR